MGKLIQIDPKAPLRWVKRQLLSHLQTLGYGPITSTVPAALPGPNLSLEAALERCQHRNLEIQTVIDVGASDGRWSLLVQKYFPEANFFLLEARQEHEPALQQVISTQKNFDYLISAAGDTIGSIYFDASDLFAGLASHERFDYNCPTITVPVTTVDHQVQEKELQPPFFLKLDTHGFEVPIFEGARDTLRQTHLICVETYNFQLTQSSLRFHEMCDYLEKLGFRCIDLCDPLHRELDRAWWQIDLLFVPATDPAFQSNQYR